MKFSRFSIFATFGFMTLGALLYDQLVSAIFIVAGFVDRFATVAFPFTEWIGLFLVCLTIGVALFNKAKIKMFLRKVMERRVDRYLMTSGC